MIARAHARPKASRFAADLCCWCSHRTDGQGMSQEDFMRKDECLILNYNDEIKAQFNADIEALLSKADENWPGLK